MNLKASEGMLAEVKHLAPTSAGPGKREVIHLPYTHDLRAQSDFRALRQKLRMLTSENATIAVCATACGEGASWAASMMACATAEDGDSVVLVDGDICKPTQKQAFEITSDRPLPLPWGGQRLFELSRTSSQQILVFSPTHLQAQTEREAGASLRGDLPGLRSQWGNVIVDCPPIPESTLLLEVASVVDGVVLVVKAEQERRDELKQKVDWLKRMGPPVLGVIFNKGKGYLPRFFEKAL